MKTSPSLRILLVLFLLFATNSLLGAQSDSRDVRRQSLSNVTKPESYIAGRGTIYGERHQAFGDSAFGWRFLTTNNINTDGIQVNYTNVNGEVNGWGWAKKCPDGYTTVYDYSIMSTNRLGQSSNDQYYTVEIRADLCFGLFYDNTAREYIMAVCGWNLYNHGRHGDSGGMFRGITVGYTVKCELCKDRTNCPLVVTPIPTNSAAGGRCDLNCTTAR